MKQILLALVFAGVVLALPANAETRTYWWGSVSCVGSCPAIMPVRVIPDDGAASVRTTVAQCTYQGRVNAACVAHMTMNVGRQNNSESSPPSPPAQ